jgi:site-specific recombinase XerD
MHKGVLLYFGKGTGKSDRDSYNKAVLRWRAYLKSLAESESAPTPSRVNLQEAPNPRGKRWNPRQVTACVTKFLSELRSKAQAGDINFSRVSDVKARLQRFTGTFSHRLLNDLDERDISSFKASQTSRVARGEAKASTVRQDFNAVRQLFDWAYKQKILNERPRNLDDLRITWQKKIPNRFFSPAQIQQLFKACDAATLTPKWRVRAKEGCEILSA